MKKILAILALAACFQAAKAFTTDTVTIVSKYVESPSKATVVVPDGKKGQKFPTVYLLHGYDGDYRTWSKVTQPEIGKVADEFGMIIVMPDGRDSWYWDSPVDPKFQMESFFTKELVPYIDANFPTIPEAGKRAITGLSMGGHGSLYLATRHPDIWKNAGSMSGGLDLRPFAHRWNVKKMIGTSIGQNPALWDEHTVSGMIPQIKDAGLNLTFDCGCDDFFARVNEKLHQDLLAAQVPHDYTSRPGTHSHKYWRNSLNYHLLFFKNAFEK